MNIENIVYDISGNSVLLSELATLGKIPHSEAVIFQKMLGLKTVVRNSLLTHESSLCNILDQFFKKNPIDKKKICYCLYAHTADDISPNHIPMFEKVLKKFELEKSEYFGVSLHKCASVFQLVKLSLSLFETLSDEAHVLILVSDIVFTKIFEYIPGSTVLSDSASILHLKKSGEKFFIRDVFINEKGMFSKGIFAGHQEQLQFQTSYVDHVVDTIQTVLDRNKLPISSIKKIFPHNVNIFSWKAISEKLKISVDTLYLNNISKIGHCFGSDPFINVLDAEKEGLLIKGDYIILVTVGLGATFAAMLLMY